MDQKRNAHVVFIDVTDVTHVVVMDPETLAMIGSDDDQPGDAETDAHADDDFGQDGGDDHAPEQGPT